MRKKTVISLVLFLITLSFSTVILIKNRNFLTAKNNKGSELVLFYGSTCPHCKVVEKYISENNIEEKIKIDYKEVYSDSANAQEMKNRAVTCGLNLEYIGVPFLWDGSNCYIGDDEIIKFLQTR